MDTEVFAFLKASGMLPRGSRVLVAYSGGADSTALLHFLWANQETLGLTVLAAHVNHGLRAASEQEEQAVRAQCQAWGVPLFVFHARLAQRPRPGGMGEEEWARQERYRFLHRCAGEQGALIATAHTRSDNAETVLMNLARGAGLRGLAGIPPVRDGVIRPLLPVTRQQVEDYCRANALAYVTDESNLTDRYARNRVRHTALPALSTVNPAAVRNIGETAAEMRQLGDFLDGLAKTALEGAREGEGFRTAPFLAAHPALRGAMLRAVAAPAGPLDRRRQALCEKLLAAPGAVQLSGQWRLVSDGARLFLRPVSPPPAPGPVYPFSEGRFPFPGSLELEVRFLSYEEYINICGNEKNLLKNGADCAKIMGTVSLRTRAAGDRYTLPGRRVTKTMKKWMNECGVPAPLRDQLPLLCRGSQVLFCPAGGFCHGLAPGPGCRRVAYLRLHGAENWLEETKCTAM